VAKLKYLGIKAMTFMKTLRAYYIQEMLAAILFRIDCEDRRFAT
jgi:hypothetical protein